MHINLRKQLHTVFYSIVVLAIVFAFLGVGTMPSAYAQESSAATPTPAIAPVETLVTSEVSQSTSEPPDAQSTTGPIPPPEAISSKGPEYVAGASAQIISNVPAYIWRHGCGPTAAGMLIGYWDGQGYDWLISGNAATQTSAVDEAIASTTGTQNHYTDYALPMEDGSSGLLADKSELPLGDEHPNNSIADFMRTSWSSASNYYGWSWFSDVSSALLGYTNMVNPGNYTATSTNSYYYDGSFNWNMFKAEIDAGRPMVLLVDSDGDGGTDHFPLAFGYDDSTGVQKYAAFNTWDTSVNWYDFGPMTVGKPWGIFGAISYSLNIVTSGNIFSDGFESGNLSKWSSSVTDGGDLSVSNASRKAGNYGLQAVIDDNASIYVTDDTPAAESRYQTSFYFDPNSVSMVSGDTHVIFGGYSGTSTLVLRVQFRQSSGNYQVQASLLQDDSTWNTTSWFTISDDYHYIELDWRAAAAGSNNGSLTLWIDGAKKADKTAADNDTRRIDRVRLGAVAGIDTGTRGTYFFDEFVSSRGDVVNDTAGPTVSWLAPVSNGQTFTASSGVVSLEVSATDPSGVNRVEFTRWDAVNNQWILIATDSTSPYKTSIDISTLNMEYNEIDVNAFDNLGNLSNQFIWIFRTPLSTTNLLLNPSFEDDSNNDSKPDNWSSNAKFTRSNAIQAIDGNYVGRFFATDNTGATIQQVVPNLTAGAVYDFSGFVNIPPTSDTFTFNIQVKWRNASNSVITTQGIKFYKTSTNNTWDEATARMVAPVGTTNILIQMIVSNLNATVYVDKFSFTKSDQPITYTLTVNKGGVGTGTVTSDPPGINCGLDCSEAYPDQTLVTLTAVPDPGSKFTRWDNATGCTTNVCSFYLTYDGSITAVFDSANNVLGNPSFEADANNDGKPDVWSTNAKFTRSSDLSGLDGTYVGKFFATDNTGATIQQVVQNLTAGTTYHFSGWVDVPTTSDAFTFKIQITWRRSDNTAISTSTVKSYTTSTVGWNEAIANIVAPVGTTNALVKMVVSSLNGPIYVDKFQLYPQ